MTDDEILIEIRDHARELQAMTRDDEKRPALETHMLDRISELIRRSKIRTPVLPDDAETVTLYKFLTLAPGAPDALARGPPL